MVSGRKSQKPPIAATRITSYTKLKDIVAGFATGSLNLVVIIGRPGLSKSQTLRRATHGMEPLIIKGRKSPIDFYVDLYRRQDKPVIIDDADSVMRDKQMKEYIKLLTETDEYKRLAWGTNTKILRIEGVPKFFHTASPVCIICNAWASNDPVYQAIESRAEFFSFEPDWSELYREVCTWFWDQEIADYIYERMDVLKEPDCRLFVKAFDRKMAALPNLPWQEIIDDYVDDEVGLYVRRLLNDERFRTNNARAAKFVAEGWGNRATFYRRMASINAYWSTKPPRLKVRYKSKPIAVRPPDGEIEAFDDDD